MDTKTDHRWHQIEDILHSDWSETVVLVLVGAIVLWWMTLPAFGAFFIGEDFIYLGQYWSHGDNYWQAVLSPTDTIFFRPVFSAINLLWQFVIPPDPWVHHFRNFVFSVVNLMLLHRVLVRLVQSRWARVVALLLFALSKIHLTNIGYINCFDSINSLMLLLLTVLFFLRYVKERRASDYVLGLLFCFLSIFTKDYGLVVVAVVVVLVAFHKTTPARLKVEAGWWGLKLAPLLAMVLFYLGLRYAIVGSLPSSSVDSVYSPQLSLQLVGTKVLAFTSTLGNLSFVNLGATGAGGLGTLLVFVPSRFGLPADSIDVVIYIALIALLVGTFASGRRAAWAFLLPLIWVAAYLGPTLLTRNLQMYYMYEPAAGASVLLAVALDRSNRRLFAAWGLALIVVGANGTISNYTPGYNWQFAANASNKIYVDVLSRHRGEPLQSITFITDSKPFWQWTLMANSVGPMIPAVMNQKALRVNFMSHEDVLAKPPELSPTNLVYDIDLANEVTSIPVARETLWGALGLRQLRPTGTRIGQGFGVQANGQSALAVDADNALPGTVIVFDGKPLETTWGSVHWLTALVPAELYSKPGHYEVYLKHASDESNRLEFVVEP